MRKKYIFATIVTTLSLIIVFLVINSMGRLGRIMSGLASPFVPTAEKTATPSPTSAPPQAPKTFQFDSSTDLKRELEKVNPQVLDSDFE